MMGRGKGSTLFPRFGFERVTPLAGWLPALGLLLALPGHAAAQGKLDAQYTATIAGIPIGRGAWAIEILDDQYSAAASGRTTGLVRIIASGEGTGSAAGNVAGQKLVPSSYDFNVKTDKKKDEVHMTLARGTVKDLTVLPPPKATPQQVPLTDAHRKGVLDPMTASIMRVPGTGELLAPESCQQHFPIFDGRLRYDINFEFKRMDKVKAEKGYSGPVVVCAAYFSPVAGHEPQRDAIKYLTKLRDAEIWFAPIAGTRVLVPFKFVIPTPIGTGVLQATQFVSTPLPTRASVKTQ
jgi:hypothetical protein